MSLFSRVQSQVSELIGQARRFVVQMRNIWSTEPTRDVGQADYGFYDRARRGVAAGLEIAGLLLKPIESKISGWVLGMRPVVKFKNKYAQERFEDWLRMWHTSIKRGFRQSVGLGDCYLVVNGDLSITVVPPNVVTPMVDENDYSRFIGWRIQEVHPHPDGSATMTIIDEYTITNRRRIVIKDGAEVENKTYPNMIGRLPVIHVANNRGPDEVFGSPEAAALVRTPRSALYLYNETIVAAVRGNIRQGRPILAIEKMGDANAVAAFWKQYGKKETITHADGTEEVVMYLELNGDDVVALGGDASLKFVSPGSFVGDTEKILAILYWLFIEHTELPEFILGTAITGSKASAEEQMPPFVRFIEDKRGEVDTWLIELIRVVMAIMSLSDRKAALALNDIPVIEWPPLTDEDGDLTMQVIEFAYGAELLDDETALRLLPKKIEDVKGVLKKAKEEAQKRREQATNDMIDQAERLAQKRDDEEAPAEEDPTPEAAPEQEKKVA